MNRLASTVQLAVFTGVMFMGCPPRWPAPTRNPIFISDTGSRFPYSKPGHRLHVGLFGNPNVQYPGGGGTGIYTGPLLA